MTRKKNNKIRPVQFIEESFHLIKNIPVGTFAFYYLGTMPFLTGLFYFWNDMSRNAFAGEYCMTASFYLVILFIWMKTWQALFSIQLFKHLSRIDLTPGSASQIWQMIVDQTIIQASAIIVLPVALIIMLPFAWTVAAYQLALIHNVSDRSPLHKKIKLAVKTAQYYTFANHMLVLIFFIFSLFVFVNIGSVMFGLPYVIKMLSGVDSAFTLGGFNPLNTTFLFTITGMTYLCVDPLFKTVFVLQKFYYQSRKTGEDLIADLNRMSA